MISFVIPCYRSAQNIAKVVDEIKTTVLSRAEDEYEIILVNDSSPDDTFKVIRDLALDDEHIIAVDTCKNHGQSSAIMCGLSLAKGEYVVCGDDDGQTPFNMIYSLKEKLDNDDLDVVCGKYTSREQPSLFRKFGSFCNIKMSEYILEQPKDLYVSAYFIAKNYVVSEMLKYENPYPYVTGLLLRTTSKIGNVDVPQRARISGASGYTFSKLLSLWINGFTAFSIKPLRFSSLIGSVCAVIGFIFGIITVIRKLVVPGISVGWSSTVAIMLFIGGLIMLMLGMIGEYIGRIYISINKSPQYVIREIVKKNK